MFRALLFLSLLLVGLCADNTSTTTTMQTTTAAMTTTTAGGNETTTTTTAVPANTTTASPSTPSPSPSPDDIFTSAPLAISVGLGTLAFLVFGAISFNAYYADAHEKSLGTSCVTIVSLCLALAAILLIPLDVYLTPGYGAEGGGGQHLIRMILLGLYVTIAVFFFVVIPFAYFYYEEEDEDSTPGQRASAACRYTSFLIVICIVIFIIGAVMQPEDPDAIDIHNKDVDRWVKSLLHKDPVQYSISFALSCMTVLGYLSWITYTGYGLTALPIGLIRGKRRLGEEEADIADSLESTREKRRVIQAKYLSGNKMNARDERTLSLLGRQERILSRQGGRLQARRQSWVRKCGILMRPFMVVYGVIFALLSLVFVLSVAMTQLNKIIPDASVCGSKCGFLLDSPWVNPLDGLLRLTAPYFPLDMFIYTGMIVYVFLCTAVGIVKLGIRIGWIQLFTIRARRTPPQALLLTAMLLSLSLLAFNTDLLTIAPYYTAYGRQTDCSPGTCEMSVVATLLNTVGINFHAFGVLFYWGTWVFVAVALLSAAYQICRSSSGYTRLNDDDSDEDEF
jgi:LMBR1 domain-containing protein 1